MSKRQKNLRYQTGCGLLLLPLMLAPQLAHARPDAADSQQDAGAAPPRSTGEDNANQGSEIIVTAQKRSERLNDVPLSIAAATGEQLVKAGVAEPSDLQKIVPGFTYQTGAYGAPIFTIRGIGFYEDSLAVAPTVSVYVDQVPLSYSRMTSGTLLDLERVEVLKGPEGTLFGQNSTGGAINYIAAKPTEDYHAGVTLGYGRFSSFSADGFVSGPLTDNLKARVAVRTEQYGDWQKSQTRNDTNGSRDFLVGRILLDWDPTPWLKLELNVNGWRDNSDTQAAQFVSYSPNNPAGYKDLEPLLLAYKRAPRDSRIADFDPATSLERRDDFFQASLRADVDLGGSVSLASITSYAELNVDSPNDTDGVPYNNFLLTIIGRIKSFSQELRLAGTADGNRLKWMIGGNYSSDVSSEDQYGNYNGSNGGVGPFRFFTFDNANHQNIKTKSVFGSLDYEIIPTVSVQGSVRYTDSDDTFRGCVRDTGNGQLANALAFLSSLVTQSAATIPAGACATLGPNNRPVPIVNDQLDEDNVSWRGALSWKPDANSLVYASVTRGYKAGAFASLPAVKSEQLTPVTQESVLAYETGLKLSNLFRTLDINAAGFYYTYDNKQVRGFLNAGPPFGLLSGLVGIPKSSVRGGEVNIIWRPIRALTVRAGATYVDSQVDKSFFVSDPFGVQVDVKGEAFPNTPKWQLTGDVGYDFPLSSNLNAYVGTGMSYRTSAYARFGENTEFKLPSYFLLDLRAGISTGDNKWRVEIWGKNVTNKYYLDSVNHIIDTVSQLSGMPVTYGARVGYRF